MYMKQPYPLSTSANLDFQWDWNQWLGSDSIAANGVQLMPSPGISVSSYSVSSGVVTAWVQLINSPVPGVQFYVDCVVVTANSPARKEARRMTFVSAIR